MKKLTLKILYSFIIALALTSSHSCLSKVHVLFTPDRIATVSTILNQNDNSILLASVGDIVNGQISDPTTWTTTTLSLTTGFTILGEPSVSTSSNGDIIVAWTYLETNFITNIAAAILPQNSSSWSITNLTNNVNTSIDQGHSLACDTNGNIFLAWGSYNDSTGERMVLSATTTSNANGVWSQPKIVIPQ